jgi:DNA-binding NarL/FixJ family response regulator
MCISVSIVDDDINALLRLGRLIGDSPGYRCLSQHPGAESALREIPALGPDVMLIALNLPGLNGVECMRRLKPLLPAMQVMILTDSLDTSLILHALAEGATGCLLKHSPPWELLYAIRDVHQGGSPMNSQIARKVVESFQQPPPFAPEMANLSPRQIQVLDLLAQGHSYQKIAGMMQLAYATVHTHIRHIYKKLQVRSRSQAVARYSGQTRRFPAVASVPEAADGPRPETQSAWPVMLAEEIL